MNVGGATILMLGGRGLVGRAVGRSPGGDEARLAAVPALAIEPGRTAGGSVRHADRGVRIAR